MTAKEAIKILEVAKAEIEWSAPLEYQEALDAAIRALELQIPKPAKRKNRTLIEYCARCERALDSDDYFCWWCGQLIER